MEENLQLNITDDIQYITDKRDTMLECFNNKIKNNNSTQEEYHKSLDVLLRINGQLKTLENCFKVIQALSKSEIKARE